MTNIVTDTASWQVVINLTKETLCQGLKHSFKESNCPYIEQIHSFVSFSSHFQNRSPRSESFTDERRAPTRAKGMRYYSKFEVKIAEQSILAPPVHSCQRSLGKHQPRAVSKPPWVADNSYVPTFNQEGSRPKTIKLTKIGTIHLGRCLCRPVVEFPGLRLVNTIPLSPDLLANSLEKRTTP